MFNDEEDFESMFKLRKKHQRLADELGMTTVEYLKYREKIDQQELMRKAQENQGVHLELLKVTSLQDNVEGLGFSKHFFTKEDARFLYDKIVEWDDDNCYLISPDESEYDEESRQEREAAFFLTGVKYNFEKVGVTIYSVFEFEQQDYINYTSCLEYYHQYYYHNHRNDEFHNIMKEDFLPISFLDE